MEKINIPNNLPDCKIINTLIRKSNNKADYDFNYIAQLEDFRKLISIEVSRINLLFPEYTPHDEQYHLKRLFYVADQMLGNDIIDNMNATELFLLSISLYGHDWGMAINEDEKTHILSDCNDFSSFSANLLDDEKARIKEFCKLKNIENGKIELDDWQEYVRLTHAFRSGKRIRRYFESVSSGVAEFASRICEGHWLDFGIIDDHTSYPTDASIHRETVNVKALTIYVRLIDLLDLGEDRTPFILWKFVAPRNKFSKLEWGKHRALQPVTFPKYQSLRSIQIDGSTDDQNVYMSIMDLKRYVDEQFRHCSDILNRINHSYHKLDISHIDWRIASRGFEPVAIQFEFDRNRMFDILGDEIYHSNPYVFVRELLQNAIDAIDMRMEILKKRDVQFEPKIRLQIDENQDHYIVQITDNGIGMDEYIIRNYLTVAGKSYYRSSDFQKEGLKMDPISRFGIGVLSCFMTSEYIEVQTFKDPNTTKSQDHFKITIPSKANYFKIQKNTEILNIGTTFKVFVIKNKLPKNKKTGNIIDFNVTEYLKKTAGFVKYQIKILENGVEATITNPNVLLGNDLNSFKIDYQFPVDKAILPQNKETVNKYFAEKRFYLKTDLNLKDFDGCITYLLPNDENIDLLNEGRSWPPREATIINYKKDTNEKEKIQWNRQWVSYEYSDLWEDDKTIIPETGYSVFLDGILIQDITPPRISIERDGDIDYLRYTLTESFINPQLIVNMSKPVGMKIDLARTNIETLEKWDIPIWTAFFEHLKNTLIKEITEQNFSKRLLSLSRLITFYKLTSNIIFEYLLEDTKFPLPFISKGGTLIWKDFDDSELEFLRLIPNQLNREFYKLLESNYIEYKPYKGILNLWQGDNSIINLKGDSPFGEMPSSISNMGDLTMSFISRNYYLSSLEFIVSPLGVKFPMPQEVLKIKPKDRPFEFEVKDILMFDVEKIAEFQIYVLNILLKQKFYNFPKLSKFKEPYGTKAFYSFRYFNINNPKVKFFVRFCMELIKVKEEEKITNDVTGRLFDMINELPFIKSYYNEDLLIKMDELNSSLNNIVSFAYLKGINCGSSNSKFEISVDDFVENSVSLKNGKKSFFSNINQIKYLDGKKEWGHVL